MKRFYFLTPSLCFFLCPLERLGSRKRENGVSISYPGNIKLCLSTFDVYMYFYERVYHIRRSCCMHSRRSLMLNIWGSREIPRMQSSSRRLMLIENDVSWHVDSPCTIESENSIATIKKKKTLVKKKHTFVSRFFWLSNSSRSVFLRKVFPQ